VVCLDYAVVDIGSNTITLAIYRFENNILKRILKQKVAGALASYVENGRLNEEGIKVACDTILDLHETALKLVDEQHIYIFATASIRNVANQDEGLNVIKVKTGVHLHVISGEMEAICSFRGADYFFHGIIKEGVMIDIGGGSTELVYFKDSQIIDALSIPVGSMNLYNQFISDIVPDDKEKEAMKKEIEKYLDELDFAIKHCKNIIGVGGTIRNYLKLEKEISHIDDAAISLEADKVEDMLKEMRKNHKDVYKVISKKIPDRVFTLYPGLMIFNEVIKKFKAKRMYISDFGVREGYLLTKLGGNHDDAE